MIGDLISGTETVQWVILAIFFAALLVQLFYYIFVFRRITAHKSAPDAGKTIPVSVVICARNEAENLEKNLPAFLTQDYDNYEVVVVNDCSTDHTDDVLMDLKVRFPHLRVTTINQDRKFSHGKKLALTVGIKAASHANLLLSDADCRPASDRWASRMTRHFINRTEIVLGIGKYERRPGLLNLLVRYETLFTAMQYISFSLGKHSYMGVGRNLAYTKELFFRNKGFASHLKLQSGDDDLFVRDSATKTNTSVEIDPEAHTISSAPTSFQSWIRQKRRHITTGKLYRFSTKMRLGTEYISRILFYVTLVWLLFVTGWNCVAAAGFLIYSVIRLIRLKLTMRRLNEKDLLLPSLLIEPLLPILLGGLRIANFFRRQEPKWN